MQIAKLINTLGVAVPTSHHWPLGDEGKQAKSHRGVATEDEKGKFKSHFFVVLVFVYSKGAVVET